MVKIKTEYNDRQKEISTKGHFYAKVFFSNKSQFKRPVCLYPLISTDKSKLITCII